MIIVLGTNICNRREQSSFLARHIARHNKFLFFLQPGRLTSIKAASSAANIVLKTRIRFLRASDSRFRRGKPPIAVCGHRERQGITEPFS